MCQPRDAGLAHELPLDALLSQYVFSSAAITTIAPDAQDAAGTITGCFPDAEVSVVNGGQPVYYYMISVE